MSLGVIWAIVSGIFIYQHWPASKPSPPVARVVVEPIVSAQDEARIPEMKFALINVSAGLDFVHSCGATGDHLLPETMGGGVAFFDYDGDGFQDLLLINGGSLTRAMSKAEPPGSRLYHNDGHGHFTDVTAGSGLESGLYGMGVAIGDYDNDGVPDVLITGVGGCRLFHNEGGGKFHDVTIRAGVGGSLQDWSTSAAFFDYDNDGLLDLFVCNYVEWSADEDKKQQKNARPMRYVPPNMLPGSFCRLYHNEGRGRFMDVSKSSGIQRAISGTGRPAAKSLGVVPIDLDGDGFPDLIVANDTVPNFAFLNQRDGTFKEIATAAGLAVDSDGKSRAGMGIDASRFRKDGALAIAIATFSLESTTLYVSRSQSSLFVDEAAQTGIAAATKAPLKFGMLFFDADLDGWEDLIATNGRLDPDGDNEGAGQYYRQSAQFFWNAGGDGTFIRVLAEKCGRDLFQPIAGRGSAFADIDGDGDLDVVMTQVGGPPLLLRNDQHLGHHWLRLKLVGTTCNRDAIGAQIRVTVGGQTLIRQVMPTRSYLSQSELPVTIGLGNATRPDRVEITWPGGQKQVVDDVAIDRLSVIRQAPAR